jgi:circadian clock protein KaiC
MKKQKKGRIKVNSKVKKNKKLLKNKKIQTTTIKKQLLIGIPGLDSLFNKPIPKGSSILIAGGPGSGKTILCLQSIAFGANQGEKCLYLSFEEKETKLEEHMEDFGWNWEDFQKKGLLKIVRKNPFALTNNIEAMLARAKGELLIDINKVLEIMPKGFKPDRVIIDSLSAISSAFAGREEGYRIFIEQLFLYFESIGATAFFISETEEIPSQAIKTSDEQFLSDGVIFLYNLRKGNIRSSAIEIIKMRGVKINKKIVPFEIIEKKGIVVYPEGVFLEEF